MSLNDFKKRTDWSGETELDSQKDIQKYVEMAEKDPDAIKIMTDYQKGIVYFFICGKLRNDRKALRLLKKAADGGLSKAMYMYGFACHHMYLNSGHDPEKKHWYEKEFNKYLRKAAESGNADALVLYGKSNLNSPENPEDEESGVRLLEAAIEKGNTEAKRFLRNYRNKKHYEFPKRDIDSERVISDLTALILEALSTDATESGPDNGKSIREIITRAYVSKGYCWYEYDQYIGTILTKNEGDSYLISEDELWDVYFALMDKTDAGRQLSWGGQNGLPYEVAVCLRHEDITAAGEPGHIEK